MQTRLRFDCVWYRRPETYAENTSEDQTITITYTIKGLVRTYTYEDTVNAGEATKLYPDNITFWAQIALSSYTYWYDESSGTYYKISAENVAFTKDVSLTASSDSPSYSVTYQQTKDSTTQFVAHYKSNTNVTVRENSFTNGSQHFVHWSTGSVTYQPGETVDFGSSKSVTLYAVWSSTTPLIVIAGNVLAAKGDSYTLGYTAIGLADSHNITVKLQLVDADGNEIDSAEAVGVYTVKCTVTDITDKDGNSVMDQYEITSYSGFLTIHNDGGHSEIIA